MNVNIFNPNMVLSRKSVEKRLGLLDDPEFEEALAYLKNEGVIDPVPYEREQKEKGSLVGRSGSLNKDSLVGPRSRSGVLKRMDEMSGHALTKLVRLYAELFLSDGELKVLNDDKVFERPLKRR